MHVLEYSTLGASTNRVYILSRVTRTSHGLLTYTAVKHFFLSPVLTTKLFTASWYFIGREASVRPTCFQSPDSASAMMLSNTYSLLSPILESTQDSSMSSWGSVGCLDRLLRFPRKSLLALSRSLIVNSHCPIIDNVSGFRR